MNAAGPARNNLLTGYAYADRLSAHDGISSPAGNHRSPAPLIPQIYLPATAPRRRPGYTFELRAQLLREVYTPNDLLDTPAACAAYIREHIHTAPWYDADREAFAVLFMNTRRRIIGHAMTGIGTLDSVLIHPREIFRPAIAAAAHAIILTHNHPGGDPTPSEADIRTTRDLIRAGQLLKIEVLDHLIMGAGRHASMRDLGYFYA